MCCLFGMLDYAHAMSGREKSNTINTLARESEIRGTDATGVAYVRGNRLRIFKRPLAAHQMRFFIPGSSVAVMGHARTATQGSERYNANNHPFKGRCADMNFALAHNGVLRNDRELRERERLPETRVRTDSYVAVQLLEKQKSLNLDSLKTMAEAVEGTFAFTVLDSGENLYFVKGDSPLCLYHFKKDGFYLYASTEEILANAVRKLRLTNNPHGVLRPDCGDILRIGRDGGITRSSFDASRLVNRWGFWPDWDWPLPSCKGKNDGYLQELREMSGCYGYSPEEIDRMYLRGYSCDEIEEILCCDDLPDEF